MVRVIHRHRIGEQPPFARVSELMYREGHALAVLSWLHQGEARIPAVCIELESRLLRPGARRNIFLYDGVTSDPRFESRR